MINSLQLKKYFGYLISKKKFVFVRDIKNRYIASKKSSNNFNKKINKVKNNHSILICTLSGDNYIIRMFDYLFYVYLKLRNKNTFILKCSKSLSLCNVSNYTYFKKKIDKNIIKSGQSDICRFCNIGFESDFERDNEDVISLKDYVNLKDISLADSYIKKFTIKNFKKFNGKFSFLNEQVYSGFIRFKGTSNENINKSDDLLIFKEYFKSAILFYLGFKKILKKNKIKKIITHHGIYIPQGIIPIIGKKQKIPFYVWQPGYRQNSIIMTKNKNVHNYFPENKSWKNYLLNNRQKNKIKNYLNQRIGGNEGWINFQSSKYSDEQINNLLKKNVNGNYLLVLNVDWDAKLHFKKSIFKDMFELIDFTIEYFLQNPKKKLIIRAHPGEFLGNVPTSYSVEDYILNKFGKLPNNIKLINSFSKINTYKISKHCNFVIVYSSKMSIEFASMGVPVICCGEAWIKNKNITFDPKNKKEYLKFLAMNFKKAKAIQKSKIDKALKFAYFYFFKKMIKINLIKKYKNKFPRYISNIAKENNKLRNDQNFNQIINQFFRNSDIIKE